MPRIHIFATMFLLITSLVHAAEKGEANNSSETLIELGVTAGYPAGFNLVAGLWGTQQIPIVARISGGPLGGVQMDLGWAFDREGSFRQFVALAYSRIHWTGWVSMDTSAVGASYGLNWDGFSAQLGVCPIKLSDLPGNDPVAPVFQVGYTFIF